MDDNIYGSDGTLFTKTEKLRWTSEEEDVLIELVLTDEEILCGPLKDQTSRKKRMEVWRQIANTLSRRCKSEKKDIMSVKKKYFNIKQRSKQKILQKRRQLGKPEMQLLPSGEAVFFQLTQDGQNLSGQDGDASVKSPEPTATTTCRTILPRLKKASETALETTTGNTSSASRQSVTASHSSDDHNGETLSDEPTVKRRKTLTIKERMELANLQNIELENERITNEILVQEVMKEKLKLEMSILRHKRDYLELKLNAAYDVVSTGSEEQFRMFWNNNIDNDLDF